MVRGAAASASGCWDMSRGEGCMAGMMMMLDDACEMMMMTMMMAMMMHTMMPSTMHGVRSRMRRNEAD